MEEFLNDSVREKKKKNHYGSSIISPVSIETLEESVETSPFCSIEGNVTLVLPNPSNV